jgi:AcrR family transcriptional regulator
VARSEGGARERKKRATRAQLEEAAFSLFLQQGYDATTVDEISDAAQVSPRTFFRYFATKEDVVFGDRLGAVDELRSAIDRGPASDSAVITDALIAFSDFLDDRRDGVLGTRRLVADNPTLESRVLQEEQDWVSAVAGALADRAGRPVPTFEQRVLAACAISVLATSLREWCHSGASAPLSSFTRQALETAGSLFG